MSSTMQGCSLSDFVEIKVIGRGSFGQVHAMRYLPTGEVVAVKRASKRKCLARRSHLKALSAEMQVLANNTSPYLLQLKTSFQTDDDLFFVLPYMHGGDLVGHFDSLDKRVGKVPEPWIRFYAAELAIALSDLHKMKIVYRDIKPENILIDGEGHIKLCDFGLSHALQAKDGFMTRGRAGTGRYMAPEVASGHDWYDCSSDMYGLGVVIVWMFEGHSDVSKYRARTVAKKYTEASRAARNLIDGLLQPDPEIRFGWDVVFTHPFFRVNWDALRLRKVGAPIGPDLVTWHQNPHLVKLKSDDAQLPELGVPDNLVSPDIQAKQRLQMQNSNVKIECRDTPLTPQQQAMFVNFGPSFAPSLQKSHSVQPIEGIPASLDAHTRILNVNDVANAQKIVNVNDVASSFSTTLSLAA